MTFSCKWCPGDGHGDHAVDCAKRERHPLDPRYVDEPVARLRAALDTAGDRATYVRVEVIDLRAALEQVHEHPHSGWCQTCVDHGIDIMAGG